MTQAKEAQHANGLGWQHRFGLTSDGRASQSYMLTGRPNRDEPHMDPSTVDALFRFFAEGEFDDSRVLPTVQELTGRAPRTFERWARAHADAFRPATR